MPSPTDASLPERLADAEGELPIDTVTIRFARRPDSGMRVVCDELPGLVMSHADHALVLADLVPAIETLVFSRLAAAESARDALKAEIREQAMKQLASDAGWELDWDKVRAERDAALARAERADKALKPFAEHGRLYAGWLRRGTAPCPRREDFEAARAALAHPAPAEET